MSFIFFLSIIPPFYKDYNKIQYKLIKEDVYIYIYRNNHKPSIKYHFSCIKIHRFASLGPVEWCKTKCSSTCKWIWNCQECFGSKWSLWIYIYIFKISRVFIQSNWFIFNTSSITMLLRFWIVSATKCFHLKFVIT